jgi:hypothetical protein
MYTSKLSRERSHVAETPSVFCLFRGACAVPRGRPRPASKLIESPGRRHAPPRARASSAVCCAAAPAADALTPERHPTRACSHTAHCVYKDKRARVVYAQSRVSVLRLYSVYDSSPSRCRTAKLARSSYLNGHNFLRFPRAPLVFPQKKTTLAKKNQKVIDRECSE